MKKLLRSVSALVLLAGAAAAADTPFWIAPCDDPATGCRTEDADLARWALVSWENASGGKLHFVETKDRSTALLRLVWASPAGGLYGETVPISVNGRQGSQIFIVNTTQGITDRLLRDTIVYLTCLHESGHALGLQHTSQFEDIMYYFGFGGDINEYFGRYRRKLATREDIRKNPGWSAADRTHLLERLR
jgi:matrixin